MSDHDRPLNAGGRREALLAGGFILQGGTIPELIISSTARRARETAELVCEACGGGGSTLSLPELYLAHPEEWLAQLRLHSTGRHGVMLIGHNPGLEGLIEGLTGKPVALHTAAIARLNLAVQNWGELCWNSEARLLELWRP